MATHSSILTWKIPWTEEPGGLQPVWLQSRVHCSCLHTGCHSGADTVLGTQSARDSGSGTGLCLGRQRDQGLWKETAWSPILPLAWADPSLSQPLSPPQGSSHPPGCGLKGNPLAPGWGGVSAKKELGFLALSWRRAS